MPSHAVNNNHWLWAELDGCRPNKGKKEERRVDGTEERPEKDGGKRRKWEGGGGSSKPSWQSSLRWLQVGRHRRQRIIIVKHYWPKWRGRQCNPSPTAPRHQQPSKLQTVVGGKTEFSGKIPYQIENLSNLLYLDLKTNYYPRFSGEVPFQFENLTNLIHLDLRMVYHFSAQQLVENLQWLSNLSSLQYIDMTFMNLSKVLNWLEMTKIPK